ncbi:type I-E CRISPR-associated protein Cse2/CasB [Streptacidiphilus sp. EB129]|jgi:CRISPR type I-E-associated protein CasB/Cse2|uniref:type I-E CRISPR-associated protein Cse2/CasB n=1 Tax=Streptacidiphilus sp. EB129 TaxID=3156262 RepID=UPI0035138135
MTLPAPQWARPLPRALARMKADGNARALAALRRSLRHLPDHADPAALPYVIPHVRPWRTAQDAGLLTAGLWAHWHTAFHQPVEGGADLGAALARLPDERTRERHIRVLVNATPGTLPRRLSAAVTDLRTHGIAPYWPRLHADISQLLDGWSEPVHRRWLTSLYSPAAASDPEPSRAHS